MAGNEPEILDPFRTYLCGITGLTTSEFNDLAPLLRTGRYKKGDVLLRPGEVCKHAFHVTHGLLRVTSLDTEGNEHILQFAPEAWYASDRGSIFFNEPSEFRIDALEDTNAVLVSMDFLNAAAAISSSFRQANTVLLHNHIRHMQDRIALLLGARADERYQKFIAMYPDLMLRVPQRMIASYLGITPESLSRIRRDLAERNFRMR